MRIEFKLSPDIDPFADNVSHVYYTSRYSGLRSFPSRGQLKSKISKELECDKSDIEIISHDGKLYQNGGRPEDLKKLVRNEPGEN